MAELRIEPFDRAPESVIRSFGHETEHLKPSKVEGIVAISCAPGTGEPDGLLLARDAYVQLDVPDGAAKMRLEYDFPSLDDPALRGSRARVVVTMPHPDSPAREVLFTRTIDATATEADLVGQVVELDLPAQADRKQADRKIAIRFMLPVIPGGKLLYARIAGVRFE
jgi:hypothetical protein